MKRLFNKSAASKSATQDGVVVVDSTGLGPESEASRPSSSSSPSHDVDPATNGQPSQPSTNRKLFGGFGSRATVGRGGDTVLPSGGGAVMWQQQQQQQRPVQLLRPRIENVAGVIGYSVASPQFDLAYVLALSDYISHSAMASKDAAKALRKELKYGAPGPQEQALKLLWLLMRNTDLRFRQEVASKKFLAELSDLVTNKKTMPSVRAEALHVLSPMAYEYQRDAELSSITTLWNKLKPPEAVINGAPLQPDDPLLNPPEQQPHYPMRRDHMPSISNHLRELQREATQAKGNAAMLLEAVAFSKESELQENQIVHEFYQKCVADQMHIVSNLEWATVQAEQARQALPPVPPPEDARPAPNLMSNNPFAAPPPSTTQNRVTEEEKTLEALLAANADITEALNLHTTRMQSAQDAVVLAQAEERSRGETRYDRAAEAVHPPQRERSHDYQEGTSGGGVVVPRPAEPDLNPFHRLSSGGGDEPSSAAGFDVPGSAPSTISRSRSTTGGLPPLQQGVVYDEPSSFDQTQPSPTSLHHNGGGVGDSSIGGRRSTASSETFVPLVPSQKALGKIRRVSMRPDEEEGGDSNRSQTALEEQLRQRYELQYREEMDGRQRQGDHPTSSTAPPAP